MGGQSGSPTVAKLDEVHYSIAPFNGGDLCKWIVLLFILNADLAVTIYRPTTPDRYTSTTSFGEDISQRTFTHHQGLQDDHSLGLPNYTYQQHIDDETAKITANTAARTKGTKAPRRDRLVSVDVVVEVDPLEALRLSLLSRFSRTSTGSFPSPPDNQRTGN